MKTVFVIVPLLFATWSPVFGLSQQRASNSSTAISQDAQLAQTLSEPVEFRLLPPSRLWIEGTTSVNSFGCEAESVTLDAKAANSEAIEATVDVGVADLECGRERMNRDLQSAMHADEHPKITYYLESAFQTESSDNNVISINAIGFLRVAGVVRKVEVLATAIQSDDDSYRLTGSLPIRMTDYNIDPPRALAGLIRVHDDIVVQFDLIVAASPTSIH